MVLAFHLCIKLRFRTVSYVQLMVRHYSFRVCNSTRGLLLLFNLFTDISVQQYIEKVFLRISSYHRNSSRILGPPLFNFVEE